MDCGAPSWKPFFPFVFEQFLSTKYTASVLAEDISFYPPTAKQTKAGT